MICKFCGNVIEDSSDFCFICGQKVAEEAPAFEAEAPVAEEPVAEEAAVPAEAPAAAVGAAPAAFPSFESLPQGTPIYAQTAPVYAHQVFIQQFPAAPQGPFVQVNGQNIGGKDPSVCSKAKKFFSAFFAVTFILQFISWIWYSGAKKQGFPKKAEDILNSTMIGLCIFMVIACGVLIFKFVI
ncbi:MAG: hypothetical protein IKJ70_06295 [Clostridia bacterium]|nr:hypothetical protein [Clostridia bacterium]